MKKNKQFRRQNNKSKWISSVPFTYMWYLKMLVDSPKTVLDLGCGNGGLMKQIYSRDWKITGIDIYEKSLKQADKLGIYEKLIKGDLVKVCNGLVRGRKKFDLVFCSQVIEHVSKEDGGKLLDLAEKLARKRIYFGTPRGFMNQPGVFIKGNPYQHHKSGWSLDEFKKRGYKVFGIGFYPIWSEKGLARRKNTHGIYFDSNFFSFVTNYFFNSNPGCWYCGAKN